MDFEIYKKVDADGTIIELSVVAARTKHKLSFGKTEFDGSADITIPEATQAAAGLLSAADKKIIDGVTTSLSSKASAQDLTDLAGRVTEVEKTAGSALQSVPKATALVLGGIKVAAVCAGSVTTKQGGSDNLYGVEIDGNGKAFVNVPWENTSHAHSAGVGLIKSGSDGTSGDTVTYKVALVNESKSTSAASYAAGGASKFYAVQLDKNGKLGVAVPWQEYDLSGYIARDDISFSINANGELVVTY